MLVLLPETVTLRLTNVLWFIFFCAALWSEA